MTIWTTDVDPTTYHANQAARVAWFNKIASKVDWKMPINTIIAKEDFADCNEAAVWFTGAGLTVVAYTLDGRLEVKGPGYYAATGA